MLFMPTIRALSNSYRFFFSGDASDKDIEALLSRLRAFKEKEFALKNQIAENPLDNLFHETGRAFSADKIFDEEERINLKPATGEAIVKELEKYNLSDTSEDLKGVAFEPFPGRTFRGEIGRFFTPRTIVRHTQAGPCGEQRRGHTRRSPVHGLAQRLRIDLASTEVSAP